MDGQYCSNMEVRAASSHSRTHRRRRASADATRTRVARVLATGMVEMYARYEMLAQLFTHARPFLKEETGPSDCAVLFQESSRRHRVSAVRNCRMAHGSMFFPPRFHHSPQTPVLQGKELIREVNRRRRNRGTYLQTIPHV